jgi:FkbH-like protein
MAWPRRRPARNCEHETFSGNKMAHPFEQIKVVIWDLDDTLWRGTLTEGTVSLPEKHRETVKFLTDAGIINSICSKNDFDRVAAKLKEMGIWDLFVFPSIDWTAKGPRTARQIEAMQLRAPNVLFLDDNHLNLEEVKYYCPGIMTGSPADIEALWVEAQKNKNKDSGHSRLKNYQMLQTKASAQKEFSSNEEFLFSSAINVKIHEDCLAEADRIHEMIARTNQLNFTKKRISPEELKSLLEDKTVRAGYVTVSDRFGDYGISGFFAVKNGAMEHFLFSCRTLGMGVEQYVYNSLGRPEMVINGEVISDISSTELPKWINQSGPKQKSEKLAMSQLPAHSILLKGPCDLEQVFPFVEAGERVDTEFTYVSPATGVTIEAIGHTTHMVEAFRLSDEQKHRVARELPFADENMYSDLIYQHPYRVVFISSLADANLGVYRRKETGERVAFGQAHFPLTDPKCHDGYVRGEYYTAHCKLTQEFLNEFTQKYEFEGCNSPEKIVENLQLIRGQLSPECLLVVLLGTETYYEKNTKPAYFDRHLTHKKINDAVKQLAARDANVQYVDVNKHITGQGSFHNSFGHFVKPVYYGMAADIVEIINRHTGAAVKKTGKGKMLYQFLRQKVEMMRS